MPEELENQIKKLNNKISELQDEKRKIMSVLEDEYDIDVYSNSDYLEDENLWVFGIEVAAVRTLLNATNNNETK